MNIVRCLGVAFLFFLTLALARADGAAPATPLSLAFVQGTLGHHDDDEQEDEDDDDEDQGEEDDEAQITLSTNKLEFTVEEGKNPPDQKFTLTNTGDEELEWEATDDAEWLRVDPNAHKLKAGKSKELKAKVESQDLEAGDYSATITITGNAENSPETVSVRLTVTNQPTIGLSAENLEFTAEKGENPPDQKVTITNTGAGTLEWQATDDAEWLSVSPTSGGLGAGSSQDLTVSVASAGLNPDEYSARITIDGNAANAPRTIDVELNVAKGPEITLSTNELEFTAEEGENPPDQKLTLTNTGGGELKWEAREDVNWLKVDPNSGDLKGGESKDLEVEVESKDLEPGGYGAPITVRGNAENSPQTVAVELTVGVAPQIGLTGTSLEFTVEQGVDPEDQEFAVTNTGGGTLEWQAAADADWLSLSSGSGALGPGASQTVTVSVASVDLEPGGYSATITITGNAEGSPLTIPVTLTVTNQPMLAVAPTSLEFEAEEGDDPAPQTVSVTNQGGGVLTWSATADAGWLSVSPSSGDLAGGDAVEVAVSVSRAGLEWGTHSATLTFGSSAGSVPGTIEVTLAIGANLSADQLVGALAGVTTLSEAQIRLLDGLGNGNGRFDVGDFIAWLESESATGASVAPAERAGETGEGGDGER